MPSQFDAIIIGSGQSGPFLAVRLAKAGKRTVLIERDHFGGTCLNDGCTPTKTLVASARAAHVVRNAHPFGLLVDVPNPLVDMKRVKARKDVLVQKSVSGLTQWLESTDNLSLVRASARFTAPHTIEADGESMQAPLIFIDVGGRPALPPMPGLLEVPYLTNVSMMDLDTVPEHLVIVGGSYIGLEFGQMYRRFGARVTILEHGPRLVRREDPDTSDAIKTILEDEGIEIELGATDLRFAKRIPGCSIDYLDASRSARQLQASHVLVATGRVPNTDGLGLDRAGIAVDQHGYIVVNDQLMTSVEGVYAMGDVNGRGAFTHTSYNDFEIVAANLLDHRSRSLADRVLAYALYIDPPLGRVGMTEAEVRHSGCSALMATMPMSRVARARERGETAGFMKVLVDEKTKLILGASILGIEGDEVIQQLALAISARLPYPVVRDVMGIHPTVSELLPTLFDGLQPLAPAAGAAASPH